MPIDTLKIAIKGSTQDHLPIEDIVDGIIVMKDGSCATVLKVSSVNFDLLSEREQSSLVFAYGGILNSLNFPIQIAIQSSTKDIGAYIKHLSTFEEKQSNSLLKDRIKSYKKFIEETVKKNDILSKTFFIVIPFSSVELGLKEAGSQIASAINPFSVINYKAKTLPFPIGQILEKAKASLEPKKDHLIRLFSRLGLEIKPAGTRELIELFYKIYNEDTATNQKINSLNYSSPTVGVK